MIPNLQIHIVKQLWKDGTKEIVANSHSQTWWEKVEFQKSV
jgi:hypothetical protein